MKSLKTKGKAKPVQTSKTKVFRHKRIKNGIMQYHDAYRQLGESELKRIPNKYWVDDLPPSKTMHTHTKRGKDYFCFDSGKWNDCESQPSPSGKTPQTPWEKALDKRLELKADDPESLMAFNVFGKGGLRVNKLKDFIREVAKQEYERGAREAIRNHLIQTGSTQEEADLYIELFNQDKTK